MEARFYNFTKRKNSTARPSGGTSINVVLKESTSILSPVLELRSSDRPPYTYCYIPAFSRYYYVTNITYVNGLWDISLSVDVLATYYNRIVSSRAFITYASALRNKDLVDNRIAPLPTVKVGKTLFLDDAIVDLGAFAYFVRAIGSGTDSDNYKSGLAPLYVLSASAMQSFMNQLNDDSVLEQLKRYFSNPMDGLVECYAMPVSLLNDELFETKSSPIYLGGSAFECGASVITNNLGTFPVRYNKVNIPWQYDDFRNNSPYTSVYLYTAWTGFTYINPSDIYSQSSLDISHALDPYTGDITFIVRDSNNRVITQVNGNIKVSLPIASVSNNVGGVITGLGTALAGMATAGVTFATGGATAPLMAGMGATAAGLSNTALAMNSTVTRTASGISGSVNDMTLMRGNCYLYVVSYDTVVEPTNNGTVAGYPVGYVSSLNLSGYVQTDGASISINGFDSEREQLNSMLNAGIYIE